MEWCRVKFPVVFPHFGGTFEKGKFRIRETFNTFTMFALNAVMFQERIETSQYKIGTHNVRSLLSVENWCSSND